MGAFESIVAVGALAIPGAGEAIDGGMNGFATVAGAGSSHAQQCKR